MLIEFFQDVQQMVEHHWPYLALGVISTILGTILASPLIVKIYESRKAKKETLHIIDRDVELNKDQELYKIREELRAEVETLRGIREQILAEKMELTHQNFLLDATIKQMRIYETELEEEVASRDRSIEKLEEELRKAKGVV